MTYWIQNFAIYRQSKILTILCLGFSSGIPFLLTLATLHIWLSENRVSNTTIGFFVLITLPYTLKFVWAPFVDFLRLPFLTSRLGQRRGWLLLSQICLMISLICLGSTSPGQNIFLTASMGLLVAFWSATQDIVFEAYRVEILSQSEVGAGAAASMLGYRLGMWISGAGSLYISTFFDWFWAYTSMAICLGVGIIATLLCQEPDSKNKKSLNIKNDNLQRLRPHKFFQNFQNSYKGLLKRENFWLIILYIFSYKVGDTILNVMTSPFLLDIGFSKIEIAHVAKSFGIGAVILGGFIGAFFLNRKSLIDVLVICSVLQIFSCLMFCYQAHCGYNIFILFITLAIENLACGIGTAGFIAYLSNLCETPFSATHYALLSSIGSLARVTFSSLAGWSADHMSWNSFYLLTACACLPCLIILIISSRKSSYKLYSSQII